MGAKKTILLVDDHALFREGLNALISRDTGYQVIGEARTGSEALQLIRKQPPDLVLLDMALPDQNGIEVTRAIKSFSSKIHVIIVSMHSKADYIVNAFKAGATGYLVKDSASEKLLEGMAAVLNGEYYMDGPVAHKVIYRLLEIPEKEKKQADDTSVEPLTPREQEIITMLAEGQSVKKIGEKLCISTKTVENHRTNIMRKLNLHSTHELIRCAAKLGLIDVDLWKA